MRIEKVSNYIGAEIHDVSIRDIRVPEVRDRVLHALHENELLIFKGLDISPGEQVELARVIGEPVPFVMSQYRHPEHPEIMISSNEVVNGKAYGVPRVGNFWHQDSSYTDNPTTYTLLHGINIPRWSGDTLFSSAGNVMTGSHSIGKTKFPDVMRFIRSGYVSKYARSMPDIQLPN